MSNKQKRFILPEDEIPRYWYNIQADMKNKPMPPLNPATHEPLKPEDLYPILPKNCAIRNSTRRIHGLKFLKKYAKCTSITEAHHWSVPMVWKSLGHSGTHLFQERKRQPHWFA